MLLFHQHLIVKEVNSLFCISEKKACKNAQEYMRTDNSKLTEHKLFHDCRPKMLNIQTKNKMINWSLRPTVMNHPARRLIPIQFQFLINPMKSKM